MNHEPPAAPETAHLLHRGLGRRGLLAAAAALGTGAGAFGAAAPAVATGRPGGSGAGPRVEVPTAPLQPGAGRIDGDHYLASEPDAVRWGYLPAVGAEPVLQVPSGATVTIDTVSHEGILEDQGRDPVGWFGEHGVPASGVLEDAVAIAAGYSRHQRRFDVDGPHVVTGPVFVEGAQPGDVLKVETVSALLRVPYGVVSSRHGKGSLARSRDGGAPAGITLEEVMPPVATDGRATGDPERYGNVSLFTPAVPGPGGSAVGTMPRPGGRIAFPLDPFMGMMGVARFPAPAGGGLVDPTLDSVPPTLGGGNIDVGLLGPGSAFYLPVAAEGALFHTGDPHFAMGDGEAALTALEGSLRTTFRLTVCKAGSGDAPAIAHRYPFGETDEAWVPIGLSDPDGIADGAQGSDLDVAARRAVVNALDFLEEELGVERPVAYAYLSAAASFVVSQLVDRTVGVHGVIPKAHFA